MKKGLMALGDSITYGYPFGQKFSWVNLLAQKLGIPIENLGTNGDSLRDIVKRLWTEVIDHSPSHVFILGGTHDVFQEFPLASMQNYFCEIIETLKKNQIHPLVGLPPPVQEKEFEKKLKPFRQFLKKYAKEERLVLVDFYGAFFDASKRLRSIFLEDGVHPSVMGYQRMMEVALPILEKVLKKEREVG